MLFKNTTNLKNKWIFINNRIKNVKLLDQNFMKMEIISINLRILIVGVKMKKSKKLKKLKLIKDLTMNQKKKILKSKFSKFS